MRLRVSEGDDLDVAPKPSRHVDYLSYRWRDKDIWTTWKYVSTYRDAYSNGTRLLNAAWRGWTLSRTAPRFVDAESLNWHKDTDVTWLYGPLLEHPESEKKLSRESSYEADSESSSPACPALQRKPILKKRSLTQEMMQRSPSTHTLLNMANSILQRQGPSMRSAAASDYPPYADRKLQLYTDPLMAQVANPRDLSFGSEKSSNSSGRHISFSEEVVQYLAVDGGKDDDDEDECGSGYDPEDDSYHYYNGYFDGFDAPGSDDSEEEDELLMMDVVSNRPPPPSPCSPEDDEQITPTATSRANTITDSKIIAQLPSTILKYTLESPEPKDEDENSLFFTSAFLSSSPESDSSSSSTSSSLFTYSAARSAPSIDSLRSSDPPSHTDDNENNCGWDVKWNLPRPTLQRAQSFPYTLRDWFWSPSGEAQAEEDPSGSNKGKLAAVPTTAESYPISPGVFVPYGYDSDDKKVDEDDSEDDDDEWARFYYEGGLYRKLMGTVNTARDIAYIVWNTGWKG